MSNKIKPTPQHVLDQMREETDLLIKDIQERAGQNEFKILSDLKKAFMPFRNRRGGWSRICCTGELNLFDYCAGLVCIDVRVCGDASIRPIKYQVRLSINTLDDGLWGAWGKHYNTSEECQKVVDKIAKEVLEDLHTLPSDKEFNETLKQYGLYGTNEG